MCDMQIRQHPLEFRVPPPVVDAACALLMWLLARAVPQWQLSCPDSWRWGLLLLWLAAGGGVALAGLLAFRRARTTPNPLRPQQASALVTGGIYRYTRNPMYLGMALALLGWACWLAHPLAFACIPLALAYLQRFQIRPEERILEQRFGEEFRRYRQRVRRWL